jgi:hypothetical protein
VIRQAYLIKSRVRCPSIDTRLSGRSGIELSHARTTVLGGEDVAEGSHCEVGLRREASVVGSDGLERSNGVRPRLTRSYIPQDPYRHTFDLPLDRSSISLTPIQLVIQLTLAYSLPRDMITPSYDFITTPLRHPLTILVPYHAIFNLVNKQIK